MPTAKKRIQVTRDEALEKALQDVERMVGRRPAAMLVRDLALRGAESLLAERQEREALLEEVAQVSTREDPGFDRAVLADIDRLAWGVEE